MTRLRARYRTKRGTAAVEFALVAPLLLLLLGGLIQFGWAVWCDSALNGAVSQASYYAFMAGPNVSTAAIVTMAEQASALGGITATASAPACYCASGTPAAPSPAASCTTNCADGSKPGVYTTIAADYTVPRFLPLFAAPQLSETATVRIK